MGIRSGNRSIKSFTNVLTRADLSTQAHALPGGECSTELRTTCDRARDHLAIATRGVLYEESLVPNSVENSTSAQAFVDFNVLHQEAATRTVSFEPLSAEGLIFGKTMTSEIQPDAPDPGGCISPAGEWHGVVRVHAVNIAFVNPEDDEARVTPILSEESS